MSARKFRFTQTNSTPFRGLDGSVTFGNGTDTTDKIMLLGATGLGMDGLQTQLQKAPFQQGGSMIRTQFDTRLITLECAIVVTGANSTGASEVTTIKRGLSKKMSPVGMGYMPETSLMTANYSTFLGTLEYAYDGVTFDRTIDAVPLKVEYPNAYYQDSYQKMRVVFFCPDPFWYGAEQSSGMAAASVGSSGSKIDALWASSIGKFACVNVTTGAVETSFDGVTYTSHALPAGGSCLEWSDDLALFVSLASSGTSFSTSEDGDTWSLRTGMPSGNWNTVKWSPYLGIFCSVETGTARCMTSPDGLVWTLGTTSASKAWIQLKWIPEIKKFISFDSASAITQYSSNGTSWTAGTTGGTVTTVAEWSKELQMLVVLLSGSSNTRLSSDGVSWSAGTCHSALAWNTLTWCPKISLFISMVDGSASYQYSSNGTSWSLGTSIASGQWGTAAWSNDIGVFTSMAYTGGQYPQITYTTQAWYQPTTSDYFVELTNSGDDQTSFSISIPLTGGETSKKVVISDNFLWDGTGTPPSDRNLVFGTDGLKKGDVVVTTAFNNKDIKQFGVSKLSLLQSGTFFSLYVSGSTTNNIYVRNTGTSAGAPTITWRNRYISV